MLCKFSFSFLNRSKHILEKSNINTEEGNVNTRPQLVPTRMLGFNMGLRFGSEAAEARPSLAMIIINVKKTRNPSRSSKKTRCFQDKEVRFPPLRFLYILVGGGEEKKKQNTQTI